MRRWMPLALRFRKIERMAEPAPDPKSLLREDLSTEYYAILNVVSNYDGWLLIVKGWSVTLSLAGLGLGFQHRHFAFFALAAVTGAAFWFLDGLMKGYQYRYYVRMREIEYTAYLINSVSLGDEEDDPKEYGDMKISAPRIDMTWPFTGYPVDEDGDPLPKQPPWWRRMRGEEPKKRWDWRADKPERRDPKDIYSKLRTRFWWSNVALPHAVAVVLGLALFIAAALNAPGLKQLDL